jgi:hypothetical protein
MSQVTVEVIRSVIEIEDNGSTVEIAQVKNVVEITEVGIQGAKGDKGDPGDNYIGGYGVDLQGLAVGDVLQFGGAAWVNTPQTEITDGGNF